MAAPTDEERAHPYLWRFWRHLPAQGGITIFDRSWYGRVLVERVEGFCSVADWMRAYDEINQFEEQLASGGGHRRQVLAADQQGRAAARFRAREQHRRSSGSRSRRTTGATASKWGDYERAVCDMVDRTSTEIAPWTLVEANDKRYARVKILKTIVKRLEDALD